MLILNTPEVRAALTRALRLATASDNNTLFELTNHDGYIELTEIVRPDGSAPDPDAAIVSGLFEHGLHLRLADLPIRRACTCNPTWDYEGAQLLHDSRCADVRSSR